MFRRLTLLLLLTLVLPIAAQDADEIAEIEAGLDALVAAFDVDDMPGGLLLLDTPDGVFSRAVGFADLDAEVPMSAEMPIRLASVTKLLTATAVMQLVEEGTVGLDDPLSDWLPDVADRLPYGDAITVRMLLDHTAGVYDYLAVEDWDPFASAGYLEPEDVLARVYDEEPFHAPDERGVWEYSNTHYTLLGMIIEAADGTRLGESFQERIFDPLGLKSAQLEDADTQVEEVVHRYADLDGSGQEDITDLGYYSGWADGGAFMTPQDLATFGRALFTGALFDDDATLALMTDFSGRSGTLADYALGVQAFPELGGLGHLGADIGYSTNLIYIPDWDWVYVDHVNVDAYDIPAQVETRYNRLLDALFGAE